MSGNKKIKNSIKCSYEDIVFKSRLEMNFYKRAVTRGLNVLYEPEKIVLMRGFKLDGKTMFYTPSKSKVIENNTKKLLDITYTPDFIIENDKYKFFIDTKGFANDVYPVKRKLFLWCLYAPFYYINKDKQTKLVYKNDKIYIFFEPHTLKQVDEVLDIINNLIKE
jgi:hypothetical protein